MDQGFFLKCEKCSQKPATIKLTNGKQDKKICFQCERDITKEPAYKDWTKQFIPYSDLKQNSSSASDTRRNHSKHLSTSKVIDPSVKSPLTAGSYSTRNYLRNDDGDKLAESIILKSPTSRVDTSTLSRNTYGNSIVSPRIGAARRNYEITKPTVITKPVVTINPPAAEPEKGPSGLIRSNTPKKKVFYSEYLKDYNPKAPEYKSPNARAVKRDTLERTARGPSSTSYMPSLTNVDIGRTERSRNSTVTDHLRTTSHLETFESPRREKLHHVDYPKEIRVSPKPHTDSSHILHTETEKRVRDVKRDDIKNRLSKLSEQFYSPIRSPKKSNESGKVFRTEETPMSMDFTNSRGAKNNASTTGLLMSGANRYSYDRNQPSDYDYKSRPKTEETGGDAKQKLTIQGYETNVANLKSHVEDIEKRHSETISKFREELKQAKEDLFKERTENTSRNNKDISNLNGKVSELERKLQEESGKNKLLEDKLEQNKNQYEKKIVDLKDELEKTRKEKDRRIEELNTQSKTQIKSNRDAIEQLQRENEAFITRLRNEYDLIVQDSNRQIENKNKEIERLKEEKEDSVRHLNTKISNLQESVRYHQELNTKLKTNLELKNDEDIKVSQRMLGGRYSSNKSDRGSPTRDTS